MKEKYKDHRTIASTPTPNKRGLFSVIVCAGAGEASRCVVKK